MTEEYKEILIDERRLYGGCHKLKMWVHDVKSGFIVYDCIHKQKKKFDNYADAKQYFKNL